MGKIKDRDNAERYERMIEKIVIQEDDYEEVSAWQITGTKKAYS